MTTALSLVCKQCDTQLKSVQEAQEHGELTGHSQFEESTEPVLNLVCSECGKPCRSQTEKDLHTKRTGHQVFTDKTLEAATAIDTETQMREVENEFREGEGLPSTSGAAKENKEVEMVPPEVNQELVAQLEEMGFSTHRAVRALHFTGSSSLEQAVNWVVEHGEDADVDEPLLVPKEEPKVKLSAEEARAAAEEMVRKAREKKAREDAELQRLQEKERIRAGKELLLAKKKEDELALKRNLEARRLEKEEEARARAKIRQKLEEDRRERRRKLGLPEETAEEERARAEAEAAAKEEKAKASKLNLPVKPVSIADKLRALLVEMKKAHPEEEERVKTTWTTMMKYIGNVVANPSDEKFRKIRLSNPAFQKRVGSVALSIDFLEKVGFKKDASSEVLEMPANAVDVAALTVAGAELNNALTNPFFGVL